jgi:hypothetical protein
MIMKKGKFLNLLNLKQAELEKMKKGENGWLLQDEDGESQNTFILNPVPNAHVCVYLMIHITKLQLQTTFPKPLYIPHSTCIHRDPGH